MKKMEVPKFGCALLNASETRTISGGGDVAYWIGYAWGAVSGFVEDVVEAQATYADYGPTM